MTSTSRIASRAMFDLWRARWTEGITKRRPYIMDVLPDASIPTYEPCDVVALWRYAHRLERAMSEAFDRGRAQGRAMEQKGL